MVGRGRFDELEIGRCVHGGLLVSRKRTLVRFGHDRRANGPGRAFGFARRACRASWYSGAAVASATRADLQKQLFVLAACRLGERLELGGGDFVHGRFPLLEAVAGDANDGTASKTPSAASPTETSSHCCGASRPRRSTS
jgi:hypothetical protein